MRILILALAALAAQEAKKAPAPFLPTDGLARTFTATRPGKDPKVPVVETWTLKAVDDLKGVVLTGYDSRTGDAGGGATLVEIKDPKGPGLFTFGRDGTPEWILQETAGELKIFHSDHGPATLGWTIPAGAADGDTWIAHETFLSCGFGARPLEFKAVAEKVTVPAGTFDALRVDVSWPPQKPADPAAKPALQARLWLSRGAGLVMADLRDPSARFELKEIAKAAAPPK